MKVLQKDQFKPEYFKRENHVLARLNEDEKDEIKFIESVATTKDDGSYNISNRQYEVLIQAFKKMDSIVDVNLEFRIVKIKDSDDLFIMDIPNKKIIRRLMTDDKVPL